ncbi:ATP-binding protein [Candidatus Woesearchaeota archaeon]|nr:ATP-binding protein [Candidatus Woesearchaeota archaeon]
MKRVYKYPLIDWIGAALHSDSLKTILSMVKSGESIDTLVKSKSDNRRYIEKILKEEIQNQFGDYRRPMLEVILNSIDAKPDGFKGDYNVNVKVKGKNFSSADQGRGMSLDEVLRFLIIPFNTEKKGVEEIGRFGVGFLSTFNYCIMEPKKVRLTVETKNGSEGYKVEFYATSNEVTDLMMCVTPISKMPTGTKVSIKRTVGKKKNVVSYLKDHLENMPSYIARLIVNREHMNDDSKFKWYTKPVKLKLLGKEVEQQAGFRASKDGWDSSISLASQGVLVKQFKNDRRNINATVSFPPAAQVVEGRDEFKIDENYNRCVYAVFRAFEEYLVEELQDKNVLKYAQELKFDPKNQLIEGRKRFILYMTGFIPSLMSALGINDISTIQNIDGIREKLFPGKKYVLTSDEVDSLKPFFKEFVEKYSFEAMSHQSQSYWKSFYKTKADMLDETLKPMQTLQVAEFVRKLEEDKSFYPNLHLVAHLLTKQDILKEVYLVELPQGDNPLFVNYTYPGYKLYINTNHPYVQGKINHSKVYAVTSEYLSLKDAKPIHHITKMDDIEDEMKLLNSFLDGVPKKEKENEPK